MAHRRPKIEAFFENAIDRFLPDREAALWLAVSGGRDSVAMLRAAVCSLGSERLRVVHVNHGLRETASRDAAFVVDLAATLGISCDVIELAADVSPGESVEERARRRRYEAIARLVTAAGDRFVAVAHTVDDQAETILHRIVRGTGLTGLAGIPERRALGANAEIVRPFLAVSRNDVTEYLRTLGQVWCEDESNASSVFTRNRIRHEALPLLATLNPNVAGSLVRLGQSAGEQAELVAELAAERMAGLESTPIVPLDRLRGCREVLMAECFRWLWRSQRRPEQGMQRQHWEALVDLVVTNRSNRSVTLPGGITARRTRTAIEFSETNGCENGVSENETSSRR